MASISRTIALLRGRLSLSQGDRLLQTALAKLIRPCDTGSLRLFSAAKFVASGSSRATQEAEEQYRHHDSFDFIAASMKKSLSHLGPWSIGDLALGVRALADAHKDLADHVSGKLVTDQAWLRKLREEVKIADAIYEKTTEKVVELCSLRPEDIVTFVADGDRMRPAYCIARRLQQRQIVLVIRGTKSLGDAITILTGSGADFQGGHTHAGMLHSAHWLLHNETATLRRLLSENPGFKLHLIGHSLGAGAAALFAMLLRERAAAGHKDLPCGILPTCTAIATPACATRDLATSCSPYVTTLVCQTLTLTGSFHKSLEVRFVQNDIVPRACLWGFEQLRQEVADIDWQSDLKDKMVAESMKDFASSTSSLVAEQYKAAAELLTGKDARTAKVVAILGDAWEAMAENASKHSDGARELLRKTSLRISLLPANLELPQAMAAIKASSGLKELGNKFESLGRVQLLKLKLANLYTRLSRSEKEQKKDPGKHRRGADCGISLAADDWWESSRVISGHHAIEPPSDSTIQRQKGGNSATGGRRKALFERMSKDVDEIAHSYGIQPQQTDANSATKEAAIGLASDGEVDAELNKLLSDFSQVEEAKRTDFTMAPRMYAPGKLIYLKRKSDCLGDGNGYVALLAGKGQSVGRIILAKSMITDHLCSTYLTALESAIEGLQSNGASLQEPSEYS